MFSLFPTDPKKQLMQMTGIAILAGADPGQSLAAMSSKMIDMKQQAEEMALRKQQLGIQQSTLKLQQEQAAREAEVQDQKAQLGEAMKAFNLSPSSFGGIAPDMMPPAQVGTKPIVPGSPATDNTNWSANDMVAREYKGDAAMPLGQEGNPMAKRIMQLPLSIRQGLANAPLAAADILQPGLTQSVEDALTTGGSTGGKAPNVVNLQLPDGTTRAFDLGDPTQRKAAQDALTQGAVEVNPQTPRDQNAKIVNLTNGKDTVTLNLANPEHEKRFNELTQQGFVEAPTKTLTEETKDPTSQFNEAYDTYVKESTSKSLAMQDQVDEMTTLGSLLLRPDIYTGAGASIVNGLGKAAQDTLGILPEVDFSNPVVAEQSRKKLVMSLRSSMPKDSQMSNQDRKYYDSMVASIGDGPDAIARSIALHILNTKYADEKAQFLQSAIRDQKMNSYQAIQAWKKVQSSKLQEIVNQPNMSAIMEHLKEGANDQSLLEYAKQYGTRAEKQAEEIYNGETASGKGDMTPETTMPDLAKPTSKEEYDRLPKGTKYLHPDGTVKVKQ